MLRITTVAICLFVSTSVFARTWVSANGKFEVEAKLVRADGKVVVLEKTSGKKVKVPLAKLSAKDRDYVKHWRSNKNSSDGDNASRESVKGTLFGKPFEATHIEYKNSTISLQSEDGYTPERYIQVFLDNDDEQRLSRGKAIRISSKTSSGAPTLHMRSRQNANRQQEVVFKGYSMTLQAGPWKSNDTALVKIQLNVPKFKTKLTGMFELTKPFDPTVPPTPDDRPYVSGGISLKNIAKTQLHAGYIGVTRSGESQRNMANSFFDSRAHYIAATTFAPRNSGLYRDKRGAYHFQHVKLEPGRYFFYVVWNFGCIEGKWVEIEEHSKVDLAMHFDPKKSGSLDVEIPNGKDKERVTVIPLEYFGNEPKALSYAKRIGLTEKISGGNAFFESLRPGPYRVTYGNVQKKVTVKVNKMSSVRLK